jgi:hypothetical protein
MGRVVSRCLIWLLVVALAALVSLLQLLGARIGVQMQN